MKTDIFLEWFWRCIYYDVKNNFSVNLIACIQNNNKKSNIKKTCKEKNKNIQVIKSWSQNNTHLKIFINPIIHAYIFFIVIFFLYLTLLFFKKKI